MAFRPVLSRLKSPCMMAVRAGASPAGGAVPEGAGPMRRRPARLSPPCGFGGSRTQCLRQEPVGFGVCVRQPRTRGHVRCPLYSAGPLPT